MNMSWKMATILMIVTVGISSIVLACGGSESSEKGESKSASSTASASSASHCPDYNPLRNVYFGDLHVHTRLSFDAYPLGTRAGPVEAYQFAMGGELIVGSGGNGESKARTLKLPRPLDFAAVTDHSEYLAETRLCTTPGNPAYDMPICQRFRTDFPTDTIYGWAARKQGVEFGDLPERFEEICGQPGIDCQQEAAEIWEGMVVAADKACRECSFTAFPAYEFTLGPKNTDLHRNIIFRNSTVLEIPLSLFDIGTPEKLWSTLKQECLDAGNGCDCISIPHNSNMSNGRKFSLSYLPEASLEEQKKMDALRAALEPLVEVYQEKGWMECRNGFADIDYDPLCDCEKVRDKDIPHCEGVPGEGGMNYDGCVSRYDFVRNVLKYGLHEELRTGVNPFKVGMVGGTDSHFANPGQVEEYTGCMATVPPAVRVMDMQDHIPVKFNPGGLTAVWAEENSRDAIFDALKRREVYATTGTRIQVRFFGGWDFPDDLCTNADLVKIGYEDGVPMGGDLPSSHGTNHGPTFAVMARKDPGTVDYPGADLQQIQIIKGWVDRDGNEREKIFIVAGDPYNGAGVDLTTCERVGEGRETLCAVWTDPDFDPDVPAFYYARVVENPGCSWRQYDCNLLASSGSTQPSTCEDEQWCKTVQERAVTSPIWYDPTE